VCFVVVFGAAAVGASLGAGAVALGAAEGAAGAAGAGAIGAAGAAGAVGVACCAQTGTATAKLATIAALIAKRIMVLFSTSLG
jgi:hypothetical protein